jgi:CRISPR/Cas system endoribonuclease Cas6 (RAMP superfamily)
MNSVNFSGLKFVCVFLSNVFTRDELLKIKNDVDKYKNSLFKESISQIYRELVYAYKCKVVKLELMINLVKKTQEAGSQKAQSD